MKEMEFKKRKISKRINGHPDILKEWESIILHYCNNPITPEEIESWKMQGLRPAKLVDTEGMPNDEWLQVRKHGPNYKNPNSKDYLPFVFGGSAVAAITGLHGEDSSISPWTTKRDYFFEKTKRKLHKVDEAFVAMEVGHIYEDAVANSIPLHKGYEEAEVWENTWFMQHPVLPFIGINIDNMMTLDGEDYLVEVKTTNFRNPAVEQWREGMIPAYYETQIRTYLSVLMEYEKSVAICHWGFLPTEGAVVRADRDLEVESNILNALVRFAYQVLYDIEPDYSSTRDLELISKSLSKIIGPPQEGTVVEIEDDKLFSAAIAFEENENLRKQINRESRQKVKDIEQTNLLYDNPLREAMGENEVMIVRSPEYPGEVFKFTRQIRKSVSVDRKSMEKDLSNGDTDLEKYFIEKERISLGLKKLSDAD